MHLLQNQLALVDELQELFDLFAEAFENCDSVQQVFESEDFECVHTETFWDRLVQVRVVSAHVIIFFLVVAVC